MHPTARRLGERLTDQGLSVAIVDLPESTRTAADAARAVGCEIGQIVKSLVFLGQDGAVMLLCAGDHRVRESELPRDARRATASEVREATGFAIGGVPPLGHEQSLLTIVDPSLQRFETVWCAAGTPNSVFEVEFVALVEAIPNARLAAEVFEFAA